MLFSLQAKISIIGYFRSKRWVINSRRKDLLNKQADYLYNNCKLCQDHFEDCMFSNSKESKRRRLKLTAVPTTFNVPNPPALVTPKRKLPTKRGRLPLYDIIQ